MELLPRHAGTEYGLPYCLPIMLALAVSVSADVKDRPRIKHVPAENVSAAKGPEMFPAYCSVCHGKDGQGGGRATDALKKRAADLTQLTRKKWRKSKQSFKATGAARAVREICRFAGNVFRRMDKPEIGRLRIVNLAAYIESLQRK